MTDVTEAASKSHPSKKGGLTPEQVAALSPDEKEALIAELTEALEVLRRPVPQPYPKWVEIDGVNQIVDSPEEEERKTHAAAAFHKDAKTPHPDEKPSVGKR